MNAFFAPNIENGAMILCFDKFDDIENLWKFKGIFLYFFINVLCQGEESEFPPF